MVSCCGQHSEMKLGYFMPSAASLRRSGRHLEDEEDVWVSIVLVLEDGKNIRSDFIGYLTSVETWPFLIGHAGTALNAERDRSISQNNGRPKVYRQLGVDRALFA